MALAHCWWCMIRPSANVRFLDRHCSLSFDEILASLGVLEELRRATSTRDRLVKTKKKKRVIFRRQLWKCNTCAYKQGHTLFSVTRMYVCVQTCLWTGDRRRQLGAKKNMIPPIQRRDCHQGLRCSQFAPHGPTSRMLGRDVNDGHEHGRYTCI